MNMFCFSVRIIKQEKKKISRDIPQPTNPFLENHKTLNAKITNHPPKNSKKKSPTQNQLKKKKTKTPIRLYVSPFPEPANHIHPSPSTPKSNLSIIPRPPLRTRPNTRPPPQPHRRRSFKLRIRQSLIRSIPIHDSSPSPRHPLLIPHPSTTPPALILASLAGSSGVRIDVVADGGVVVVARRVIGGLVVGRLGTLGWWRTRG